jgi:hypothetical protein
MDGKMDTRPPTKRKSIRAPREKTGGDSPSALELCRWQRDLRLNMKRPEIDNEEEKERKFAQLSTRGTLVPFAP